MFLDNPHLTADRNINPKINYVHNLFNLWRKTNLGECTEKPLFTDLEKEFIHVMICIGKMEGGLWFTDSARIVIKMVMSSH